VHCGHQRHVRPHPAAVEVKERASAKDGSRISRSAEANDLRRQVDGRLPDKWLTVDHRCGDRCWLVPVFPAGGQGLPAIAVRPAQREEAESLRVQVAR